MTKIAFTSLINKRLQACKRLRLSIVLLSGRVFEKGNRREREGNGEV
jgi:hypothetical protein